MAALNRYFVHTAEVERYEGEGSFGPQYANAESVPCWLNWSSELAMGSDRNTGSGSGQVLVPSDADIPMKSRVTVDGRTAHVTSVQELRTPRGIHHKRVTLE